MTNVRIWKTWCALNSCSQNATFCLSRQLKDDKLTGMSVHFAHRGRSNYVTLTVARVTKDGGAFYCDLSESIAKDFWRFFDEEIVCRGLSRARIVVRVAQSTPPLSRTNAPEIAKVSHSLSLSVFGLSLIHI